jgi:hypothetical protein
MIMRVFQHVDVDLDHVPGFFQQLQAIRTEVVQAQMLARLAVALGQTVDGDDGRVILDACVAELDHHVLRVVFGREQVLERCS